MPESHLKKRKKNRNYTEKILYESCPAAWWLALTNPLQFTNLSHPPLLLAELKHPSLFLPPSPNLSKRDINLCFTFCGHNLNSRYPMFEKLLNLQVDLGELMNWDLSLRLIFINCGTFPTLIECSSNTRFLVRPCLLAAAPGTACPSLESSCQFYLICWCVRVGSLGLPLFSRLFFFFVLFFHSSHIGACPGGDRFTLQVCASDWEKLAHFWCSSRKKNVQIIRLKREAVQGQAVDGAPSFCCLWERKGKEAVPQIFGRPVRRAAEKGLWWESKKAAGRIGAAAPAALGDV